MPTKHPRHAITETPEVASALDSLRAATGEERVNFAELVILGARVKAKSIRAADSEAAAALEDLAGMVRSGSLPVDLDAADEARSTWARSA
jgi:hypothetical protein